MTDDRPKRFLDALCQFEPQLRALLVFSLLLLALTVVSLTVVRPGTATYVVAQLNLVALGVFSTCFGLAVWLCRTRT